MELKDLKRPLVVIGTKKVDLELNQENLDTIYSEVKGLGEGCVVITGTNESGDFLPWVCCGPKIPRSIYRGLEISNSFRDEEYEEITTVYSTHVEIHNMDWDEVIDSPLEFCQTSLELLFGVDVDQRSPLDTSTEFDVFYYDNTGYETLFKVCDNSYECYYDDDLGEMEEFCSTLKK